MKKSTKSIIAALSLGFIAALAAPAFASAYAEEDVSAGKTADLYFLIGGSNASGQTRFWSNRDRSVYNNVLYCGNTEFKTDGKGSSYEQDFAPVAQGMGRGVSRIGLEFGMARHLDSSYAETENTDAVILKSASLGSTLVSPADEKYGSWAPKSTWDSEKDYYGDDFYAPEGLQLRYFEKFVEEKLAKLPTLGYSTINVKAVVFSHGEEETGDLNAYESALTSLISDVRDALSEKTGKDCSATPFVISSAVTNRYYVDPETKDNVREEDVAAKAFVAMQKRVANAVENTYFCDNSTGTANREVFDNRNVYLYDYNTIYEAGQRCALVATKLDPALKAVNLKIKTSSVSTNKITTPTGYVFIDYTLLESYAYRYGDDSVRFPLVLSYDGLVETDESKTRVYSADYITPAEDTVLVFIFTQAKAHNITVETINADPERIYFGDAIRPSSIAPSQSIFDDESVTFNVYPKEWGTLRAVKVNGKEIDGVSGQTVVHIDDVCSYLGDDEDVLNFVIIYNDPSASAHTLNVTVNNPELGALVTASDIAASGVIYDNESFSFSVAPNPGMKARVKLGETEIIPDESGVISVDNPASCFAYGGEANITVSYYDPEAKEKENSGGSSCAAKAMETLLSVLAFCSLALVVKKLF